MRELDSIIIGLDLRSPLDQMHFSAWTDDRRVHFLIKPEVAWPLSVDRAVWGALAKPPNGHPLDLWGSIDAIQRSALLTAESGNIIEIRVTRDELSEYWEKLLEGFVDSEAHSTYTRCALGYDVADHYLVSGLTNCQLSDEELRIVRKNWGARVNVFGLLTDSSDAAAFQEFCNDHIPEHAPFCVYEMNIVL